MVRDPKVYASKETEGRSPSRIAAFATPPAARLIKNAR